MRKYFALGAVAPLAVLVGSLALGGAANAAPLTTWQDTSVQVFPGQSVDAITGFTATLGSTNLTGSPQNVAVSGSTTADVVAHGTNLGALTYAIVSGANPVSGIALSINNSGHITATVTPPLPATAPTSVPPVVIKATDGVATGFATLNIVPVVVSNSVHSVNASVSTDTVTLSGANNNATGAVDFTSVPPSGVGFTLANSPAGTALSGSSLVGTSAVPGPYDHVRVTAADSAGATAVDTFNIFVKGHKVFTPPPHFDHPYVLHGKWTSRTPSTATVSWDNSDKGWPSSNKCNEVYITGYGFGPLGDFADAHVGFTCDNGTGSDVGYLRGLLPGHTYALQVVPATGDYGHHHPIPGGGAGYVDVFTLADFS